MLKDDINVLEYPNWVLDPRTKVQRLTVKKENGTYELTSAEGLPTHFDKIVLYCLLYHLLKATNLDSHEITTTRYQIAKDIFDRRISDTYQFDRIMKSLKKWKSVAIAFEGIFYTGNGYTERYFGILDDVILDKSTRALTIRFNQQYVQLLRESQFYKYIDFNQYKKLNKAVAARLYEILIKSFKDRNKWHITIQNLAEKLTLEKRSSAKAYFPSDVLIKLKPALQEINDKTELLVYLDYNKETGLCSFENHSTRQPQASSDVAPEISAQPVITHTAERLVPIIVAWGICHRKATEFTQLYSTEKIKHKLELLKQNKERVKNVSAWLSKALKENWDDEKYRKQLANQQHKAELVRKRKEQEEQKRQLEQLKVEHSKYTDAKALELYRLLPAKIAKVCDAQFAAELEHKQKKNQFIAPHDIEYTLYLKAMLLDEGDLNFQLWLKQRQESSSP